jgi:hypothetical protein
MRQQHDSMHTGLVIVAAWPWPGGGLHSHLRWGYDLEQHFPAQQAVASVSQSHPRSSASLGLVNCILAACISLAAPPSFQFLHHSWNWAWLWIISTTRLQRLLWPSERCTQDKFGQHYELWFTLPLQSSCQKEVDWILIEKAFVWGSLLIVPISRIVQ